MLHTPTPHDLDPRDALTHPRFARRPDLVVAYLALSSSRTEAGTVDLPAAQHTATHSLTPAEWAAALSTLTKLGLLYLHGLEPRLAPLATRTLFESAMAAFTGLIPTLRAKTIAACRGEAVKALELAGFDVTVDERIPAGAKRTVPVHALAAKGGERLALVCCSAKAVESNARKLTEAAIEHAFLLVHPSNELVDARAVEVSNPEEGFDPGAVELPGNVPREAWLRWVAYRRERKSPLTRQSVREQLKVLAEAGAAATDVIATSINSSWQGLFPPRRRPSEAVPRGTAPTMAPRFQTGEMVEVCLPDGRTKIVTAEVVSSHHVIDETGATHNIENVMARQSLRRASSTTPP